VGRWLITALLAAAAHLVACSSTGTGSNPRAGTAPSLAGRADCFYAGDVQDFRVLSASSLLVFAPNATRAYQVGIAPPAYDLRFAQGIAFAGSGGRICGTAGESLLLGGTGGRQRFSVISVNALDQAAVDVMTGRASPPGPPPPTGDAPGAAIDKDPEDPPP
jgi:hypothetical protein